MCMSESNMTHLRTTAIDSRVSVRFAEATIWRAAVSDSSSVVHENVVLMIRCFRTGQKRATRATLYPTSPVTINEAADQNAQLEPRRSDGGRTHHS